MTDTLVPIKTLETEAQRDDPKNTVPHNSSTSAALQSSNILPSREPI